MDKQCSTGSSRAGFPHDPPSSCTVFWLKSTKRSLLFMFIQFLALTSAVLEPHGAGTPQKHGCHLPYGALCSVTDLFKTGSCVWAVVCAEGQAWGLIWFLADWKLVASSLRRSFYEKVTSPSLERVLRRAPGSVLEKQTSGILSM